MGAGRRQRKVKSITTRGDGSIAPGIVVQCQQPESTQPAHIWSTRLCTSNEPENQETEAQEARAASAIHSQGWR